MKPAYISDDGQVFDTEQECLDHERFMASKGEIVMHMVVDFLDRKSSCSSFSAEAFVKDRDSRVSGFKLNNDSKRIDAIKSFMTCYVNSYGPIGLDSPSPNVRQLAYELIALVEAMHEAYCSLESFASIESVRRDLAERCMFIGLDNESFRELMDPDLAPDENCLLLAPPYYEYFSYTKDEETRESDEA